MSAYPHEPGHKGRDTGRAAAAGMAPKAGNLRARVLAQITKKPGTPEEVAEALGIAVMNARPRCSELSMAGKIYDSGERRQAAGGRMAIVWKAVSNG